jgi:sec-independent protein translocase protein TatA
VNRTELLTLEVIMRLPGGWELFIILIIVLLLFGPGRLSRIAGEIGKSIREFRSGLQEFEEEDSSELEETKGDDDLG